MIETKRLIIRKHKIADWNYLHSYLSLSEIYEFEPGEPINEAQAKEITKERADGNDFFAVDLKDSGYMIGHLYFHRSDPKDFMTWELGYIFNPKFQNQGYCTEASSAIINYSFKELNAHKVVAFCNPRNTPSWKVLEKIGMEREGFFKQKAYFRRDDNGIPLWHDCYAYGILNNCT